LATLICPLTLQEVMLLLRNTMMGAYKDSQAAVQGCLPFRPSGSGSNSFTPFLAGTNSCALDTLDMFLPTPLVENIRSLAARRVPSKTSKGKFWYLPVLGQMFQDELSAADYTTVVTIGGVPQAPMSVFQTGAVFEATDIDLKGNESKHMLAETLISLIDGTTGSSQAFINDPEHLKTLCTLWNAWLNGSGIAQYSTAVITLGTEKGINVLCSVAMTRIWGSTGNDHAHNILTGLRPQKTTEHVLPCSSSKKKTVVSDTRFSGNKKRSITSTVYAIRQAFIDVSQGEILGAPYEQVQGTWILPLYELLSDGEQPTSIQKWQFIMEEQNSKARSSGIDGVSLAAMHSVYASKMTRSKLAPKDDWSEFFTEMARTGRGGILTGLVAGLVGAAFPALGGVANTIADALPI